APPGAVRVGLEYLHAACGDAARVRLRLVVRDLRTGSVAEGALVHEWKVAHVEKVLDHARPARPDAVGPCEQHLMVRRLEQLEARHRPVARAEAHPDDAMRERGPVGLHAGFRRRCLLRMRRHQDASPVDSVGPAVVRTLQGSAFHHLAQRQPGAAVDAKVTPGEVRLTRAPEDDVLAEQPSGYRTACRELLLLRDRVPVVDQDRVFEHRAKTMARPSSKWRRDTGLWLVL